MEGLTKVNGIGTEDIIAFLTDSSIPHEVTSGSFLAPINRGDGYAATPAACAFKSRITMHPENRDKLREQFQPNHDRGSYRAYYRADQPNFLNGVSGLVEILDGLVVVDTIIDGSTRYKK